MSVVWFYSDLVSYTDRFRPGGGYSHILAIRVCAAGEGMVFKPFGLVKGMVFKPFGLVGYDFQAIWSGKGYGFQAICSGIGSSNYRKLV